MYTRSKKLKRLEDVSQDLFAVYSNYFFELVIFSLCFKKLSKLVSFALLIMSNALLREGRGCGLVKCSLTYNPSFTKGGRLRGRANPPKVFLRQLLKKNKLETPNFA